MCRVRLKEYQNSYAEQMVKYGLQRDIEGSEAKHVATSQYYRGLYAQNEILQEMADKTRHEKSYSNNPLCFVIHKLLLWQ